ncbi:MAG: cell division protein FtsZ [Bacteroidota bacterium]|nr:cell division protein FtsZ [Bacteroidota bacterium]
MLKFDLPKNQSSIIKVIGVGGGGSNAVTHMYRQGIKGVDFIICNTDVQAMEASPIPIKLPLGANLTGGLGAGAIPSVGKNAALENIQDLKTLLEKETKMLFITAGLGGGTGTGAAPVIASISKELGILTVGIVTIPFSFEGRKRKQHAEQGISELKKYVDALVIICNDKLRDLYGDQRLSAAFSHADDVLTTAAKGIAEIITVTGYINVDFEDVKTVMHDSGVAIMGCGIASGENRAMNAVEMALNSPLLNDNNIKGANNILLYIASGKEEITMDEVTEITDFISRQTDNTAEVIWGNGIDESLEDQISVTIIATGFDEEHRKKQNAAERIIRTNLYDEKAPFSPTEPPVQTISEPTLISPKQVEHESPIAPISAEPVVIEPAIIEPAIIEPVFKKPEVKPEIKTEEETAQRMILFEIQDKKKEEDSLPKMSSPEPVTPLRHIDIPVSEIEVQAPKPVQTRQPAPERPVPDMDKTQNDRVQKLKALSEKLKSHVNLETNLQEIEDVPAYKRRNIELSDIHPSSESQAANYSISGNSDKQVEIKTENPYLHKKVD